MMTSFVNLESIHIRANLPTKRDPYWHALLSGRHIGFRRTKSGKAIWFARYMLQSTKKYQQQRLGPADPPSIPGGEECLTFDQAVLKAQAIFKEKALLCVEPNLPQTRLQGLNYCPIGNTYTVAHALRDYIDLKRISLAQNSLYRILSIVNRHILSSLGPIAVDDLKTEHVVACMNHVLETCPTAGRRISEPRQEISTLDSETLRKRKHNVNALLLTIRGTLKLAWQNKKTDNDRIWRSLELFPRQHKPRTLHLSTAECRRLLRQCDSNLRKLVVGALYTGCRASELFNMRAGDVGRDGFGVYVYSTKTSTSRFVFLPEEGMAFLLKLASGKIPEDRLFTMERGMSWTSCYTRRFKRVVIKANLPKRFTFHGLRHTYASQLVQAGAPLSVIAEQLGHANTIMVSRTYAHIAPQIREAEIQQRFVSFKAKSSPGMTTAEKKLLRSWRKRQDAATARPYARIADLKSVNNVKKIF